MAHLADSIMSSFESINSGDSYYLSEKSEDLKDLSNWEAIGYLRFLDREHKSFVADRLGLQFADIESALELYIAVCNRRAFPATACNPPES